MQIGTPPASPSTATASLMLVSALETVTIFSALNATDPTADRRMMLAGGLSLSLNAIAALLVGSWWPLLGALIVSGILVAFYRAEGKGA